MRRTITVLLTAACLALAGCSGSDEPDSKVDKPAASTMPSETPPLSEAEITQQCSAAVAEAAPGWEDWNVSPGDWQTDPRTPEVCLGLADETNPPAGNRAFMAALIAGLELADDPRARS